MAHSRTYIHAYIAHNIRKRTAIYFDVFAYVVAREEESEVRERRRRSSKKSRRADSKVKLCTKIKDQTRAYYWRFVLPVLTFTIMHIYSILVNDAQKIIPLHNTVMEEATFCD